MQPPQSLYRLRSSQGSNFATIMLMFLLRGLTGCSKRPSSKALPILSTSL